MRVANENDHRNDMFFWILIVAFGKFPGYIDSKDIHPVVARYIRELESRGIKLEHVYQDCVSGCYTEFDNAVVTAIEYDIVGLPQPGRTRAPVYGNINRLLLKQTDLTEVEVRLAKIAAEVAHLAYCQGTLDKDLEWKQGEKNTSAAAAE